MDPWLNGEYKMATALLLNPPKEADTIQEYVARRVPVLSEYIPARKALAHAAKEWGMGIRRNPAKRGSRQAYIGKRVKELTRQLGIRPQEAFRQASNEWSYGIRRNPTVATKTVQTNARRGTIQYYIKHRVPELTAQGFLPKEAFAQAAHEWKTGRKTTKRKSTRRKRKSTRRNVATEAPIKSNARRGRPRKARTIQEYIGRRAKQLTRQGISPQKALAKAAREWSKGIRSNRIWVTGSAKTQAQMEKEIRNMYDYIKPDDYEVRKYQIKRGDTITNLYAPTLKSSKKRQVRDLRNMRRSLRRKGLTESEIASQLKKQTSKKTRRKNKPRIQRNPDTFVGSMKEILNDFVVPGIFGTTGYYITEQFLEYAADARDKMFPRWTKSSLVIGLWNIGTGVMTGALSAAIFERFKVNRKYTSAFVAAIALKSVQRAIKETAILHRLGIAKEEKTMSDYETLEDYETLKDYEASSPWEQYRTRAISDYETTPLSDYEQTSLIPIQKDHVIVHESATFSDKVSI